ncbi:MAG: hypothetical protein I8H73_17075 [Pseudomonadales bacterium]|nr:hypothetical protein [Pseudomonadales bacterium]
MKADLNEDGEAFYRVIEAEKIVIRAPSFFAKWVEADGRFMFSDEDNGGVEIAAEQHAELFALHPVAMVIVPDADGRPVLVAEPKPKLSTEEVEALRLQAYANPVTGCDRYFSEVARLQAMGGAAADIEATRTAGTERYEAIKAQYPWP